jgi:hypothetical protein
VHSGVPLFFFSSDNLGSVGDLLVHSGHFGGGNLIGNIPFLVVNVFPSILIDRPFVFHDQAFHF